MARLCMLIFSLALTRTLVTFTAIYGGRVHISSGCASLLWSKTYQDVQPPEGEEVANEHQEEIIEASRGPLTVGLPLSES